MKTYSKPITYSVILSATNLIAASMKFDKNKENVNDVAWTRGQGNGKQSGGFGSGMWEDMK